LLVKDDNGSDCPHCAEQVADIGKRWTLSAAMKTRGLRAGTGEEKERTRGKRTEEENRVKNLKRGREKFASEEHDYIATPRIFLIEQILDTYEI
jgi:hypothetical protein